MKNKYIIAYTFIAILFSSSTESLARGQEGNGGDVVFCSQPKNAQPKAEVLDLYEARIVWGIKKPNFKNLNYHQIVTKIVNKQIRPFSPSRADSYIRFSKDFIGLSDLVNEELPDIPDSQHIAFPSGCKVRQIAINYKTKNTTGKLLKLNKKLWDELDQLNKAVLILHEAVYTEALQANHNNSIRVREFVKDMLAQQLANTFYSFKKLMKELKFPYSVFMHKEVIEYDAHRKPRVADYEVTIPIPENVHKVFNQKTKDSAKPTSTKYPVKGHLIEMTHSINFKKRESDTFYLKWPTSIQPKHITSFYPVKTQHIKTPLLEYSCLGGEKVKFYDDNPKKYKATVGKMGYVSQCLKASDKGRVLVKHLNEKLKNGVWKDFLFPTSEEHHDVLRKNQIVIGEFKDKFNYDYHGKPRLIGSYFSIWRDSELKCFNYLGPKYLQNYSWGYSYVLPGPVYNFRVKDRYDRYREWVETVRYLDNDGKRRLYNVSWKDLTFASRRLYKAAQNGELERCYEVYQWED